MTPVLSNSVTCIETRALKLGNETSRHSKVTWRDGATLLAEVRQWGGNALADRFRGLLTPRHQREWLRALEGIRDRDGLIRVSVELIYGHAWCPPERRLPDGLAPIRVIPRGGR